MRPEQAPARQRFHGALAEFNEWLRPQDPKDPTAHCWRFTDDGRGAHARATTKTAWLILPCVGVPRTGYGAGNIPGEFRGRSTLCASSEEACARYIKLIYAWSLGLADLPTE